MEDGFELSAYGRQVVTPKEIERRISEKCRFQYGPAQAGVPAPDIVVRESLDVGGGREKSAGQGHGAP